jgi:threonine synthase
LLYPRNKVSKIQEKQLTTLGENITALEVEGSFDDCQRIVKTAFGDRDFQGKINFASANSINLARLIPQSFYYFYTYAKLVSLGKDIVFSVPSGNFGNITAGLLSKKMGLPIYRLIGSTNANDVVPRYLESGKYDPKPSVSTISNAMDVGDPSNFYRLKELFPGLEELNKVLYSTAFTDEQTKSAIKKVYDKSSYLLDPHGAVGYLGLERYRKTIESDSVGVIFETAHPAKFKETVEEVIAKEIPMPANLADAVAKEKKSILISSSYDDFKENMLKRVS